MAHNHFRDDSWVVVNPLSAVNDNSTIITPAPSSQGASTMIPNPKSGKRVACRFWATSNGCRAASKCHFYHDLSLSPSESLEASSLVDNGDFNAPQRRQYNAPVVPSSKIVSKPTTEKQKGNPRAFEIQQVHRRFSSVISLAADGTDLDIKMTPSDPDFPFELSHLVCTLHVPSKYPVFGLPSLAVKNAEMERVHQAAVEKGFDSIVAHAPKATLLTYLNILDKQLEKFLSGEKEEVKFKLVANRVTQDCNAQSQATEAENITDAAPLEHRQPVPIFSELEMSDAAVKRNGETRQLEARLGRLPLFARIDDYTYTLPLEPRHRDQLPIPLQSIKMIHLHVPEAYPLEPCTITIPGMLDESAILTEAAFEERAQRHKEQTLLSHINYLSQNLNSFATQLEPLAEESRPYLETDKEQNHEPGRLEGGEENTRVHYTSKPPEWDSENTSDNTVSDFEAEEDSESAEEDLGLEADLVVAIDLVDLELVHPYSRRATGAELDVEYAEIVELRIAIQCNRCKTVTDMKPLNIWPNHSRAKKTSAAESITCPKCTSLLTACYRPAPISAQSARAGFLDLTGCTVDSLVDYPAVHQVCKRCSCDHVSISQFVSISFQSRPLTNWSRCSDCRDVMPMLHGHPRFLRIATKHIVSLPPRTGRSEAEKHRQERIVHGGTRLSRLGICDHYGRSYRWFRFDCCARMYPCDKCHDAAENHYSERASRMLCGFCSREQRYHPSSCQRCGACLTKKTATTGFWEGGKGTRDRSKMSRKDPRKHKRSGGVKVISGSSKS